MTRTVQPSTNNEWGIVLHHKGGGIAKLQAVDQHGCTYVQFMVDYFAQEQNGECHDCGKEIAAGWLCLDDSTEYCSDHIGTFCRDDVCSVCEMPRPAGW
jgi:hypothetical protein